MKIAVLNEFSQVSKNGIIVNELKKVVEPMGHQVYNAAMEKPLLALYQTIQSCLEKGHLHTFS
ncbi:hypothetical protein [Eubacterium sp.]|uniref:hypothetical protein n=1 Tax=Eubacterium sp. TaxID=142586 RepID=UPI0026DFEE4C|nr:hypothetical protein [Eubacterium sp.]MDO5434691.1 hypothetical protein [Eubacterium sp.]